MVLTLQEELFCKTLLSWCGADQAQVDVEETEECIFISPKDFTSPERFFYRLWRPISYFHLRNIILNIIVSSGDDKDILFSSEPEVGLLHLKFSGFVRRQVVIESRYTFILPVHHPMRKL